MIFQASPLQPLSGNKVLADEVFMQRALALASLAAKEGEVPVGAVMVLDNEIIAEGYNAPIKNRDPSAHAEMVVLREAAKKIGNYRLLDTTLYVTLEPCLMCAGAMVHARIKRLVYGAADPRTGVIKSQANLLDAPFLNHKVEWEGDVLASSCGELLKQFFKGKR